MDRYWQHRVHDKAKTQHNIVKFSLNKSFEIYCESGIKHHKTKPNIKTKDIMEVSHEINIYTNLIINNKS
jgi:hypothetical protein